jgi:hypothetical protein
MEELNLLDTRHQIIHDYARWCAFSSTRSGSPLKARADIYPLIDKPDYGQVLDGSLAISSQTFNQWHEESVDKITKASHDKLCVGWAAKLINVYLKTMVYVASIGRPGLVEHIHPPIDGGLWEGIKNQYKDNQEIYSKTHSVSQIKAIKTYQQYRTIIDGIELIADAEKCRLIEVEKLWEGTDFKLR